MALQARRARRGRADRGGARPRWPATGAGLRTLPLAPRKGADATPRLLDADAAAVSRGAGPARAPGRTGAAASRARRCARATPRRPMRWPPPLPDRGRRTMPTWNGWRAIIALTLPGRPRDGAAHFERFRAAVETPISLGRAGYWLGRARRRWATRGGAAAYGIGAALPDQLLRPAGGRAGGPADGPRACRRPRAIRDWRAPAGCVVRSWRPRVLLQARASATLAERFLTHLAESLTARADGRAGRPRAGAGRALCGADDRQAGGAGRRRAAAGLLTRSPTWGSSGCRSRTSWRWRSPGAKASSTPRVVSPAGARGLMQLMPATAQRRLAPAGR